MKKVTCPICEGEGQLDSAGEVLCDYCDGLGVVEPAKDFERPGRRKS